MLETSNAYIEELEKDLFENGNNCVISKEKIEEELGIGDMSEEQLLSYIDVLVSENERLKDIEDKIKAKIEEYCKKSQTENEHVNCYDYAVYFLQELLEEE